MTRTRTRVARNARLSARVKVWIERDGQYAFGLGIADILDAVDRAGSIKQAARDLGKSYRHVWQRIREVEDTLGKPLVRAQVGGSGTQRSTITPLARQLVDEFFK